MKVQQLDLSAPINVDEILSDVHTVVMCVEQESTQLVEQVLAAGVNYVDISASYSFLAQVEQLDRPARDAGSTAILGVGLTPGLTNLLAKHLAGQVEQVDRIEITIMLGLGDAAGSDAYKWTLKNATAQFQIREDGKWRRARGMSEPRRVPLLGRDQSRVAYRFNFADQHVIAHTQDVPTVSTRLCFDSASRTHLLMLMARTGILGLLKARLGVQRLAAVAEQLRFGAERYVAQVEVFGSSTGSPIRHKATATGMGQAKATGLIAAYVAQHLYLHEVSSGVHYIEQFVEPECVFNFLQSNAVAVHVA